VNEEDLQKEKEKRISYWLNVIVRGLTLRQPISMRIHGHRETLYIQARFPKEGAVPDEDGKYADGDIEMADIAMNHTPNFHFSIHSEIEHADFKGEWPPRSAIQEQVAPKIVVPNSIEAAKVLKNKGASNG
jgi:hypothetical protein